MTVVCHVKINGLPKTINASGRKHWAIKAKEAKLWRDKIYHAVISTKQKPVSPLKKAMITLIRHSSVCPDFDGLVSSFKHVLDGLVDARVIEDDNYDVIGTPNYMHIKSAPKKGRIEVIVEANV